MKEWGGAWEEELDFFYAQLLADPAKFKSQEVIQQVFDTIGDKIKGYSENLLIVYHYEFVDHVLTEFVKFFIYHRASIDQEKLKEMVNQEVCFRLIEKTQDSENGKIFIEMGLNANQVSEWKRSFIF